MREFNIFLDFLRLVVVTTFNQLFWLLGLLFVFGLVLYLLARFTRQTYRKSVGYKLDIIATGWVGTPVHELGHAVFCLIFGHRINEMKLFTPNSGDGTLGYVNHSFNNNSIYQRIGNFFIGVGPIIFGAVVLYSLLYFLVPNRDAIIEGLHTQSLIFADGVKGEFSGTPAAFLESAKNILSTLFTTSSFSDYRFWIFLYLAICISSHMELSPPDIKGASGGLLMMVLFFLLVNMVILGLEATGINNEFGSFWQYVKIERYEEGINNWMSTIGALFVFATVISGLNFLVSYISLSVYNILRGKGFINPLY